MKYSIITFGCEMNKSDSERIKRVLKKEGLTSTEDNSNADIIIVNACAVRQSAMDRVYGQVQKIKKWKKDNPDLKAGVTGCLLEEDRKKLKEKYDFLFDIRNLSDLPKILNLSQKEGKENYLDIKPDRNSSFSAFVPIMNGCNNFCSYCAVPYTRGREQSRSVDKIIKEIGNLSKKGYKEIWLLGQNVNSYKPISFAELLYKIEKISGDFWIRFTSPHPKDFTDSLIEAMATCDKVTPYFNLPLQSGNNEILKRMNRSYTVEEYKKIVHKVRKNIPSITLSTDIIVGFPGETKAQFQNTLSIFKEIGFDMAYISKYSKRPGTKAAQMEDNVSLEEKKRRERVLTQVLKKSALKRNKEWIGKKDKVLFDQFKDNTLIGKTKHYKTIKVESVNQNFVGKIKKVKINQAKAFGLKGEII